MRPRWGEHREDVANVELEHGWRVFAANLWNGIDAAIIVYVSYNPSADPSLYMLYAPLRLIGVLTGDAQLNDYAISILSCESALLFPRQVVIWSLLISRLAFFFLAGNVLVM